MTVIFSARGEKDSHPEKFGKIINTLAVLTSEQMMGVSFLSRFCAVISTHLCVEGSLANVQYFWKLIWKLIYRLLNSKKGSRSEFLGQ